MLVQIVNISRFSQLGPTTYKEESDDEDWGDWTKEAYIDANDEVKHEAEAYEVKNEAEAYEAEAYEADANYEVKHEAEVKNEAEAYEAYDASTPWQYWIQEP